MNNLQLKIAALKDTENKFACLLKIAKCKNIISNKEYKRFITLKDPVEWEISQLEKELKMSDGFINDRNFNPSYGEIIKVKRELASLPLYKDILDNLQEIWEEISNKNDALETDYIQKIENEIATQWLWPTSTFYGKTDFDNLITFASRGSENINKFFINHLMNQKRIENTLLNWQQESLIKERYPILDQGVKAHLDKQFYASVSTLVPQVEGLLGDVLESQGKNRKDYQWSRQPDVRQIISLMIQQWNSKALNSFKSAPDMLNSLQFAVPNLYNEYIRISAIPDRLYRHGICHGLQLNFGTEKNSLQLILIIDRIIFFYTRFGN